jgi:hypothetical protein
MKSLLIKDLAVTKELGREELAGVRGGSNGVLLFGPVQSAQNGGGFSFASPVIQVAPQIVTPTETNVDIASVIASMNTALSQAKLA